MRYTFPLILCSLWLGACANHPKNPAFDLSYQQGSQALKNMAKSPVRMQRPLLILNGIFDPGVAGLNLKRQIAPTLKGHKIFSVQFSTCTQFDQCKARVFKHVKNELPEWNGKGLTPELDVIGISMGGLVARYASLPDSVSPDGPQLNIRNLYTICSPNRGAELTVKLTSFGGNWFPFGLYRDLRPDSQVVKQVFFYEREYPINAYVRLDDGIVGDRYTAPQGQHPWWVPGKYLGEPSHFMGVRDKRILADIARRLRGEPSFTTGQPTPIPDGF